MIVDLHPFNKSHLESVLRWENDPAFRDEKFFEGPYTVSDMELLLDTLSQPNTDAKRFVIVVNDRPNGIADLCEINRTDKSAFVTILNAIPTTRRSGIALQGIVELEKRALQMGLTRLFAWVDNENQASLRLFTKAGYIPSSISRDLIVKGVHYIHVTLLEKCLKKE